MAPSEIALYVRVAFAVARGDWGLLAATIRDHTGSAADVEDRMGADQVVVEKTGRTPP